MARQPATHRHSSSCYKTQLLCAKVVHTHAGNSDIRSVTCDKWGEATEGLGSMNSDEILRVLNGLEPVDTTGWVFCVISDASSLTAGTGRMAGEIIDLGEPDFSPFEKGEIIVLDGEYGREPFGEGRKPAKWDVAEEYFPTLAEAEACRGQVLAGTWPRRYAPPGVSRG